MTDIATADRASLVLDRWLFEPLPEPPKPTPPTSYAEAQKQVQEELNKESAEKKLGAPRMSSSQVSKLDALEHVAIVQRPDGTRFRAHVEDHVKGEDQPQYRVVQRTADGHFKLGKTIDQDKLGGKVIQVRHEGGLAKPVVVDDKLEWIPVSPGGGPAPRSAYNQPASQPGAQPGARPGAQPTAQPAVNNQPAGNKPPEQAQAPTNKPDGRTASSSGSGGTAPAKAANGSISTGATADDAAQATQPKRYYVVRRGDTPSELAAAFGTTVKKLADKNSHLTESGFVRIGDKIELPDDAVVNVAAADKYDIKVGSTLTLIAQAEIDRAAAEIAKYPLPPANWMDRGTRALLANRAAAQTPVAEVTTPQTPVASNTLVAANESNSSPSNNPGALPRITLQMPGLLAVNTPVRDETPTGELPLEAPSTGNPQDQKKLVAQQGEPAPLTRDVEVEDDPMEEPKGKVLLAQVPPEGTGAEDAMADVMPDDDQGSNG